MSAAGEAEPPALDSQRGRIGRLLRSPLLAQGAGFAGSQAAVMLLAAVSTVLVARGLSTQGFGSQAFAVSFLTFTAMFFDFGIALPVARLTAARPQSGRRQMVGTGLLVFVPIGVLFSAAVFGLSFFVDSWFHAHVAGALRLIAAVAFVYPFAPLGNYLAQATDRLHTYSVTSVASQALYVAAVAVVIAAGVKLSVALVLELRLAGMLVS
ncbi:MAG: oligosaccharide flippase family protein, partial [Solirubrobacterales bacterium]|nr:oligosaccharide flippase family protein [Solirubrobacterales bacterium]MBV9473843.1 oligosaccharide flippase family protein [Solirubrobacterales bacterium]